MSIINKKLDKDMFTNDKHYFISFLNNRFDYLNSRWKESLEKRFNKTFIPIYIISAERSKKFTPDNYIIINKRLLSIRKRKGKKVIATERALELNQDVSNSPFIQELIDKLVKKQKKIFIIPYTSSLLKINNKNAVILGVRPKISTKLSHRENIFKVFRKCSISTPFIKTFRNYNALLKVIDKHLPCFIYASYAMGGKESKEIYSREDLEAFHKSLRKINRDQPFIMTHLIPKIKYSPNVSAIVTGKHKTDVLIITDQILHGHSYAGTLYPSIVPDMLKKKIITATKKVGNQLSEKGFRGMFGIDFLITPDGNHYATDLNCRRQGSYLGDVLMCSSINLIDYELLSFLGEPCKRISYKKIQVPYAWALLKIQPKAYYKKIKKSYIHGNVCNPFSFVGSSYSCIYYPINYKYAGTCLGYVIMSGKNRNQVLKKIKKRGSSVLKNIFS